MPSAIPLDSSLGAMFIGIVFSTAIYGVTCLQAYNYFMHHSLTDKWFLKLFVTTLWVLETSHVALLATCYYGYTVTNYGDYVFLAKAYWPLTFQVLNGDMITVAIHLFFAWRIYLLSGKRLVIPGIIYVIVLAQFILVIVWIVKLDSLPLVAEIPTIKNVGAPALAIDMSGDILVTASMIYYLRKNRSSFRQTNHIINTLATYTFNTGLLTTIFTFLTLVFTIHDSPESQNMFLALFFFIEVRLYSCSFLAVLNSRTALKEYTDDAAIISISNTSLGDVFQSRTVSDMTSTQGTGTVSITSPSPSPSPRERAFVTKTKKSFDLEQARAND